MNASKEKKSLSVFVNDSETKEDDKIVFQRVGFEISRDSGKSIVAGEKLQ